MNITRTLFERILQQPVHHIYDVLVIGFGILDVTQFQHLLKIANALALTATFSGSTDRTGKAVELGCQALDVGGIGNHSHDIFLQHMGEIGFPTCDIGFSTGYRDFGSCYFDGDNVMTLGKSIGHHFCYLCYVNFERIDAVIFLTTLFA